MRPDPGRHPLDSSGDLVARQFFTEPGSKTQVFGERKAALIEVPPRSAGYGLAQIRRSGKHPILAPPLHSIATSAARLFAIGRWSLGYEGAGM